MQVKGSLQYVMQGVMIRNNISLSSWEYLVVWGLDVCHYCVNLCF